MAEHDRMKPKIRPAQIQGFGQALSKSTNPAEIATGLMKQDSPLMRQAATQGRQFANRRGLINSSIAAGASQAAALNAVVPLASQAADINAAIAGRDKAGVENMVTTFQSLYQNTVANILANKTIKGEERNKQIEAAKANLNKQTALIENLYNIDIAW